MIAWIQIQVLETLSMREELVAADMGESVASIPQTDLGETDAVNATPIEQ